MAGAATVAELLAEAPAKLRFESAAGHISHPGETRSYLADGRMVVWRPARVPAGARLAVDGELHTREPPPTLKRALGVSDGNEFWCTWTRLEVICKLLDVPIMVAVSRREMPVHEGLALASFRTDRVMITVGARTGHDEVSRCRPPCTPR